MRKLGKKVNLKKPAEVDNITIRRDSFLPSAYVIELPLDSQPGYVWQTIFEREWKRSLDLWERKVVIIGDKLLLITTPNEMEEKIDWLQRMLESANMRVEEFNQAEKAAKEAKTEDLRRDKMAIRDALRRKLTLL